LKFILSGLGRRGREHIACLKSLDHTLVGVHDPNLSDRQDLPKETVVCHLYSELLALDADGLIIASPEEEHFYQLELAIEAGWHVLCEKPLVTTQQEFRSLGYAWGRAAKNNLVITTSHPMIFFPGLSLLLERLPSLVERHGSIRQISTCLSMPPPYGRYATSNLFLEHACHDLHWLGRVVGPPREILVHRDSPDACNATVIGSDEIVCNLGIHRKVVADGARYEKRVEVIFDSGCAMLSDALVPHITVENYALPAKDSRRLQTLSMSKTFPVREKVFPYADRLVLTSFVEAIRGNAQVYAPLSELLAYLKAQFDAVR